MGNSPPVYQQEDLYFRINWQTRISQMMQCDLSLEYGYKHIFDPRGDILVAMKAIRALRRREKELRCIDVSLILNKMNPRIEPGDVDNLEDIYILTKELLAMGVDIGMVAFVEGAHRRSFWLRHNFRVELEDKIAEEKHEMIKLTNKKKRPSKDFTKWIGKHLRKINKEKNTGQNRIADVYMLWRYRRFIIDADKNLSIEDFVAYLQYYGYKLVEVDGKLLIDGYRISWW